MKFNFKKLYKSILCIGLAGVVFWTPITTNAETVAKLPSGVNAEEIQTRLDGLIYGDESGESLPAGGGSVHLSVAGEEVYASDFGYADSENGIEISKDTVFEWGTASHLLVWISVLQLEEEGLIDLQAEVSSYLPEGELKENLVKTGITMDHLMNYSSGFQDSLSEKIIPEGASYATLGESLVSSIPRHIYPAGNVVSVSDWPVALAAYIVEVVSGTDYAEYVNANIFTPLGMSHTAMLPDLSDNEGVINARKEVKSYQGNVALSNNIYYMPLYPAGMVTGTSEDFHAFAEALLVQDGSSKLFDKKETAQTLFETTKYYTGSEEARIANGMFVYRFGVPVYGINGNSASQTAYVYMEPESGICLTYMSNQYNEKTVGKGIAETVFGVCEITPVDELSGLRVYEGVYVPGNATIKGKETFNGVLSAMFLGLGEGNTLVMPMLGNSVMFTFVDEDHVMLNDGSLGNIHTYADSSTVIMMPMQDYVYYSSFTYFAQIIAFFAMLAGYFYASLVILTAIFGFIMRKINKQKQEVSKFRKYHYIQCLNITIFSLVFIFMVMMVMSYVPAASIATTAMMYWLGSVMSVIYLIFFWKTGRKEEVSKKSKVLYWTTAVFALIMIIFAALFGLIL